MEMIMATKNKTKKEYHKHSKEHTTSKRNTKTQLRNTQTNMCKSCKGSNDENLQICEEN